MTAAKKFLLAALATVALLPATARGAQYTVHACGDGNNNSFFGAVNDSRMAARSLCAADADGYRLGVAVLAGVGQGQVPVFANATQSFLAPPGTTIARVHLKADARTAHGDWAAFLQASTDRFGSSLWNVAGCLPRPGIATACQAATPSVAQNYDLPGATGFRSVLACGNFAGCGTFTTGVWPFSRAYYLMHQVDVTLNDPTPPTVAVIGGELAETAWMHGSGRIVYDTDDNSGVSRTRLIIDDTVFDHFERPCDYTFTAPCGTFNNLTYTLDTSRIGDGPHRVTVAAYDATDVNRGAAVRTVLIDNHAPAEPSHPSVDGGEGWHTTDDFAVHWTNPASAAPITRALYEICRPGGAGCVSGEQTGNDISQLSGLHVAQPGDYTIRVWLADAAGNLSDAKSSPLHLKFDNVPPAQAQSQHRNGWVNKNDAKRLDQQIDPNGAAPASGIAGYAVTSDGTEPDAVGNVSASAADAYVAHTVLTDLPEGTRTLKARAISGAGVASREVGSTDLHVDLTPPELMTGGEPSGEAWSNKPVFLTLGATDPGTLSGMAGRPSDQPITSGAYLTYSIDGVAHEVRGTELAAQPDGRLEYVSSLATTVAVGVDGIHRITFHAADVAGNATSERSFGVKIDQAPPELAVFEAQQRSDPSLI